MALAAGSVAHIQLDGARVQGWAGTPWLVVLSAQGLLGLHVYTRLREH